MVRPVLVQRRRPFRCVFLASKSHWTPLTYCFTLTSTLQFPQTMVRPVPLQRRRPFCCVFPASKSHCCLAKVFITFSIIPTTTNYPLRTFLLFTVVSFSLFGFDSLRCAIAIQPIRFSGAKYSAAKIILFFVMINPALLNDRSL